MELGLDAVVESFSIWRSNRVSKRERIPEYLWEQVKSLSGKYSVRKICLTLGISHCQFKKNVRASLDTSPQLKESSGFVQADLPILHEQVELRVSGKNKTLTVKCSPHHLSLILPMIDALL